MSEKKQQRLRRARPTRAKIKNRSQIRLAVHRTPRHIYAQIISPEGRVIVATSTLNKALRARCTGYTGNIEAAKLVGEDIALKAKAAGVIRVAFDRSGNIYHGRVAALADAAREAGLEF